MCNWPQLFAVDGCEIKTPFCTNITVDKIIFNQNSHNKKSIYIFVSWLLLLSLAHLLTCSQVYSLAHLLTCSLAHLLNLLADWLLGHRGVPYPCYLCILYYPPFFCVCVCVQSRVAVGSQRGSGVPSLCILYYPPFLCVCRL